MPSERVEDGDIFKIYELALNYIKRARKGDGPAFIECFTSRWKEHVGPNEDFDLGYRSENEIAQCKKNDQLEKLSGLVSPRIREAVKTEVEAELADAFTFAEESAFPGPETLHEDLFKEA